jgi:hypothetical protein
MNRRSLLAGAAAVAATGLGRKAIAFAGHAQLNAPTIEIVVDPQSVIGTIPPDFMGLGYEISSAAAGGPLSSGSRVYGQLVRTLGRTGVIRVGGNTSDYSSYVPSGRSVSTPKGSVINEANLRALGAFLDATGWKLIWGLNLGNGSEEDAVVEVQALTKVAGSSLIAFEIGNEPDLFAHEGHRKGAYTYEDYLGEYRRYKEAIRKVLPNAPFAGPDVAGKLDWVTRFAADEGGDLKLLTCHYYREDQNPSSTLAKLLHPDPGLAQRLKQAREAAESVRLPYRICETNSFSGGGRPGVSDTFGAALWAMDFMFTLAAANAGGVNIQTGINQLDFVSSYSPLRGDVSSGYSVGPDYYGMLAFAQATPGKMVAVDFDAAGLELTAYAVIHESGELTLAILNKESSQDAHLSLRAGSRFTRARALWLRAPRLESKDGVTLGGASIAVDGSWKPKAYEQPAVKSGTCELPVPAASGVILTFAG